MSVTLNELIYDVKNMMYAGLTSDDSDVSNEQIAHWIHTERAALLKLDLEKSKHIGDHIKQVIPCVRVECKDAIECCELQNEGISSGVKIRVTTKQIPDPVFADMGALFNPVLITYVGTVDNKYAFEFTSKAISRYAKHAKYKPVIPIAYYLANKIYVTNLSFPTEIEYIRVEGVFADPSSINELNECNKNCFSYDDPYPITPYLLSPLKDIILKKYINFTLNKQIHDSKNNAKDS